MPPAEKSPPSPRPVVLVVEDDLAMRRMITEVLGDIDAEVKAPDDAHKALEYLERHDVAVVLTDLCMPAVGGLEVLRFAKRCNAQTQVVLITGHATMESAIDALKAGAYDYLRKPFELDDLRRVVGHALQHHQISGENAQLRENVLAYTALDGLIGKSPAIEQVRRLVRASAGYDCCVLVTGESGTGKEVVAHQIHQMSHRREGRFVALNCAAIPENVIESEFFGHQRGAFTGAERAKAGFYEIADKGTLFLDEVNNASGAFQAKLLRTLQDGTYYRMGDTTLRQASVRLIAASNRPLPALVDAGAFRMDLYYRLKIVEIVMPPLRERRSDIPLLANHFLARHVTRLGKPVQGLTPRALAALMRHNWPGNVRELENAIQSMIILTESDWLDVDVLPPGLAAEGDSPVRLIDCMEPQSLEEIEAHFIAKTLRQTKGNRTTAAEILGIDKSTLWRKIKRYELE